jgi:hypothetical protein
MRFLMTSTGLGAIASLSWLGLGWTEKQVEKEWERARAVMAKSRGEEVRYLPRKIDVIIDILSHPSLLRRLQNPSNG